MTIRFTTGDIFNADCEALVNPVNCVGVMGAGLAAQFAWRWPEYAAHYKRLCKAGKSKVFLTDFYRNRETDKPKWLVSFPTKKHWKDQSDYNLIAIVMGAMLWKLNAHSVKSVAIPALGCGLGGLRWSLVKSLLETAESYLPSVEFVCYEPVPA